MEQRYFGFALRDWSAKSSIETGCGIWCAGAVGHWVVGNCQNLKVESGGYCPVGAENVATLLMSFGFDGASGYNKNGNV